MLRSAFKYGGWLAPGLAARSAVRLFTTPRRFATPQWERMHLRSGHKHIFKCGVRAWRWGEGPRVLLVHGWEGRGSQMSEIGVVLAAAGFEAYGVDWPAHGDSPGTRTNMPACARLLVELGIELGGVRGVVGHSFGGGALVSALRQGLQCERAVVIASPADMSKAIDYFAGFFHFSPRLDHAFRRRLTDWAGADRSELHIADAAAALEIPALIAHDPQDKEVRFASAEEISRSWRGSRLLPLPKTGHRRILRSPALIGEIVRFLK